MTRQRLHRRRRRERGLCETEGCKEHTGEHTHCPRHAEQHRQRRMRRYYRSKAVAA